MAITAAINTKLREPHTLYGIVEADEKKKNDTLTAVAEQ